jgi:hypothetical protein
MATLTIKPSSVTIMVAPKTMASISQRRASGSLMLDAGEVVVSGIRKTPCFIEFEGNYDRRHCM